MMWRMKDQNYKIKENHSEWTAEELKEAEENLEHYFELVLKIYERIRSNPDDLRDFRNLTGLK